mmetsp:Transcript_3642/g.9659  ORF Transcript_3642/g.9659 Transcript_3642/m.9659 type:complete len:206 (-) Transcript_3642:512-1129(-)
MVLGAFLILMMRMISAVFYSCIRHLLTFVAFVFLLLFLNVVIAICATVCVTIAVAITRHLVNFDVDGSHSFCTMLLRGRVRPHGQGAQFPCLLLFGVHSRLPLSSDDANQLIAGQFWILRLDSWIRLLHEQRVRRLLTFTSIGIDLAFPGLGFATPFLALVFGNAILIEGWQLSWIDGCDVECRGGLHRTSRVGHGCLIVANGDE